MTTRHSTLNRVLLLSSLAYFAILVVGCDGRGQVEIPAPAGASQGLTTFVFFYTDN